jgi:hypothetical protein
LQRLISFIDYLEAHHSNVLTTELALAWATSSPLREDADDSHSAAAGPSPNATDEIPVRRPVAGDPDFTCPPPPDR